MTHGLTNQKFQSYKDISEKLDSKIDSKYEDFCHDGIRALRDGWRKVVSSVKEYFG